MSSTQITNFLGAKVFGPAPVPQGLTRATISLDGVNMTDPAMTGSLLLDLSLDSGVTWATTNRGPETDPFPCTMEFQGGVKDRHGNPIPAYSVSCNIPHPELATRQVRATLTVAGVALTTIATLTTT